MLKKTSGMDGEFKKLMTRIQQNQGKKHISFG